MSYSLLLSAICLWSALVISVVFRSVSCLSSKHVFMFLILICCLCLGHSSPLGTCIVIFEVILFLFCLLSNFYLVLFSLVLSLSVNICQVSVLLPKLCFLSFLFFLLVQLRPVSHFCSICVCYVSNSLSRPIFAPYLSRLIHFCCSYSLSHSCFLSLRQFLSCPLIPTQSVFC